MRIKNKFSFFCGLFCLSMLILAIILHKDPFVIAFDGIVTFINITIGIVGVED